MPLDAQPIPGPRHDRAIFFRLCLRDGLPDALRGCLAEVDCVAWGHVPRWCIADAAVADQVDAREFRHPLHALLHLGTHVAALCFVHELCTWQPSPGQCVRHLLRRHHQFALCRQPAQCLIHNAVG